MQGIKPWYQSLTVNASLVGAAAALMVILFKLFGIEMKQEEIEALILAGVTVATSLAAIYGRIRAKYVIK